MRTRPAFTLIETLVVISLISLLISLLLPSLNKAKEESRAVVCASNQRQMGLAFGYYIDDNVGTFPYYRAAEKPYAGTKGTEIQYHWFERLRWELDNDKNVRDSYKPWICPSDPTPGYDADLLSYGYNYQNLGDFPPGVTVRLIEVTEPSRTIVTADSDEALTGIGTWGSVISPLDGAPYLYPIGDRHNGKANVMYADWHVDRQDPTFLNTQVRNVGSGDEYWWDANEGPRKLYSN